MVHRADKELAAELAKRYSIPYFDCRKLASYDCYAKWPSWMKQRANWYSG